MDGPKWSDKTLAKFRRDFKQHNSDKAPWKNWIHLDLYGLTVSGHATNTTLNGTMRSLFYAYCYLEAAGIPEPWRSDCKEAFVIASGDDTVFFVKPEHSKALEESILKLSTRTCDKDTKLEDGKTVPNQCGYGQCIKKVVVGDRFDVQEFCSKFVCSPNGTLGETKMIRNPAKALFDKQIVTDKNIEYFEDPFLHKLGCLIQLKAEKISKIIEDIVLV